MNNINCILDNAFDIYVLKIDIHMLFFEFKEC
jgi:hypothetical protein